MQIGDTKIRVLTIIERIVATSCSESPSYQQRYVSSTIKIFQRMYFEKKFTSSSANNRIHATAGRLSDDMQANQQSRHLRSH